MGFHEIDRRSCDQRPHDVRRQLSAGQAPGSQTFFEFFMNAHNGQGLQPMPQNQKVALFRLSGYHGEELPICTVISMCFRGTLEHMANHSRAGEIK